MNNRNRRYQCDSCRIGDYGPEPTVIDIENATLKNKNYRTTLWTGKHLQSTLMCIPVGSDIGLEMHENVDQFIRIESGYALVTMGRTSKSLCKKEKINSNYAVFIPAGTWHNIINIGNKPLKLYSIYAPPQHPYGTVQRTKEDAQEWHSHY